MGRGNSHSARLAGEYLASAAIELHAAGIELPVLEAQMLLAKAVGANRSELYLLGDRRLSAEEARAFGEMIVARCGRQPMAYLRGSQEFYGLAFEVSDAVLIPRPETELLIDYALEVAREAPLSVVVDAGTGSGCVATAVAAHCPGALVVAVDIARAALEIAVRNAGRHGTSGRVLPLRCDMLSSLRPGSVDLVLSNPPYITSAELPELPPEVRDYEPQLALDGGPDGLKLHRQLAHDAAVVLKPGGRIAVEVAMGQAEQVIRVHAAEDLRFERVARDLAGIDRVVVSRKPGWREHERMRSATA